MQRRSTAIAFLILCSACSGGSAVIDSGSGINEDTGPRSDAAPLPDAGPVADSGPSTDSGPLADADASTDAGPAVGLCEPTAGDEVFEGAAVICQRAEIAVMRGIASPHLEIRGDIQIIGRDRSDCVAVDSAQIVDSDGRIVADLGASRGREGSPFGPPIAEGPIAAEVVALCVETERFDRFLVELTGRVDGGSFTVTCGTADAPATFWPPKTMVTCHEGLGRVPGDLSATEVFPGTDELRVTFPLVPGGPVPQTVAGSSQRLYLQSSLGFGERHLVISLPGPSFTASLSNSLVLGGGLPAQEVVSLSEDMVCDGLDGRDVHLLRLEGSTDMGTFVTETLLGC